VGDFIIHDVHKKNGMKKLGLEDNEIEQIERAINEVDEEELFLES
jgi:NACalpha-BTF3-like transcription factor